MTENQPHPRRLVLTNDLATGRITVDMEAFFDFSFWMAEELQDLVQRYRQSPTPSSPGQRSLVKKSNCK